MKLNLLNRVPGLLIAIFGLWFAWYSTRWNIYADGNPGPAFFPFFLGSVALLCGIMLTIQGVKTENDSMTFVKGIKWCTLIVILGFFVIFTLKYLGIALNCAISFVVLLYAAGYRKKWMLLIMFLTVAFSLYVVFGKLLHLPNVTISIF